MTWQYSCRMGSIFQQICLRIILLRQYNKMDCFPIFEGYWWQKYQICLLLNGGSGFHGDQATLICCFADHAPCTTSTLAGLKSGWTQLCWQVCTVFYTVSLQFPPLPTTEPGRGASQTCSFPPTSSCIT